MCSYCSSLNPLLNHSFSYDHSWLVEKETHHCTIIASGSTKHKHLSARDRKLRIMFQDLIQRDKKDQKLVKSWFDKHRNDGHRECWGISWGGRDQLGNIKLGGREKRLRTIWRKLIEKDYRREMRCL